MKRKCIKDKGVCTCVQIIILLIFSFHSKRKRNSIKDIKSAFREN